MRSSSLVLAALALLVALPAAVPAKTPKPVGRLLDIKHDDVYVAGSFVTEEQDLYANRSVETKHGGNAFIQVNKKTTKCTVRSGTRLIVVPSPKVALRITSTSGEVWCATHSAKGSVMFDSPGTRLQTKDPVFGIVVSRKRTVVKVQRGALVLSGRKGRQRAVVVAGGQQATVPRGGDPAQPAQIQLTAAQRQITKGVSQGLAPQRDLSPPAVEITSAPPATTEERVAVFRFASKDRDVTFACAVDDREFHVCTSPYRETLALGRHVFRVRAVDAAGNAGKSTERTWTIGARPAPDRIAFVSNRDNGNREIYVMNADGSGQTRVTTNGADDQDPDWSPDRGRLAFHSDRDGTNPDVYVMNADGTGVTRLTSNQAIDRNPTWSPDGRRIAFESYRDDGNRDIYVMTADGSDQTRVTTNAAQDLDPAWSPDGRRIVFASLRDGNYEIYVMNADGSGQTRLTNTATFDYGPTWAPASRIAFHSNRTGSFEIFLMNPDGSNQVPITDVPQSQELNPTWSPDGTRIAFQTERDGQSEIYSMNADGSGQTNLTKNPSQEIVPDW
jgi:Tol biopolymer transport system component